MNETRKTGIFLGIAAVTAVIAITMAWPSSSNESEGDWSDLIDEPLFPEFKDPLVATSLKVVTVDEEQGELANFEVRKDSETGQWTIPSKGGYPADAIEQMKNAANSLVDLRVLDVPTDNAQDHSGMGVVEPNPDELNVGEEGVGRLVTFKDAAQKELASLIIGDEVKDQPGKIYVRKPGQDPVYVVSLDDTPLTTDFQTWIEEDLLQLSSIDVENVQIKDYSATIGIQGVSLKRNYAADLTKEGSQWELASLKEYDPTDPLAQPTEVTVEADKKLNTTKLNNLNNALDDLKFVDVLRKPEGISANLKADKEFADNREAASQLATRGFIPVPIGPNQEIEILSANGELTATTKDGVQYILRFGNFSGFGEESAEEGDEKSESSGGGANRYLMVSTVVDESKFPAPELQPIPQNLKDLELLDNPPPPEGTELPEELNRPDDGQVTDPETMKKDEAAQSDTNGSETTETDTEEPESKEAEAESTESDPKAAETPAEKDETPESEAPKDSESADSESAEPESADEPADEEGGQTDASGEGQGSGSGGAQQAGDEAPQVAEEPNADATDDATAATEAAQPADPTEPGDASPTGEEMTEPEETEEEKLERLATVQERITKENERKLEERKDKLDAAKRRSQELNQRFADWYYVIPEDTYTKLRISREELFDTSDGAANPAAAGPSFGLPQGGLPPGFGN